MSTASKTPEANCAACPFTKPTDRRCVRPEGKNPPDCPTVNMPDVADESLAVYKSAEFAKMATIASQVERAGYAREANGLHAVRPRIVELVDFAKRMGYKKLGLIFCIGLRKEAAITEKILATNGFEVTSCVCKVGCLPKSELGLTVAEQLRPKGHESMCNPAMQAEIANRAGTQLNILLGLCVGHDSLVLAHLKAPSTILAVKDRLMGHNPLAALYMYDSYYAWMHNPMFPEEPEPGFPKGE
ncbi:conserved hypothetical protein [uncultured delta proteobacterium]|uniref:Metal-binding protein n=1 Tax=uncultured delta proteobacterium TaxID=34034 RepID=A0A212JIY2_9DELT|nr:conserved hypothetical protein [uncultured delta proteobacterium]